MPNGKRGSRAGRAVKARRFERTVKALCAAYPDNAEPVTRPAGGYFNVPEAPVPAHACDLRRQVVERAGVYASAHGAPMAPLAGDKVYHAHHKGEWRTAEVRDTTRDPADIGRAQGADAMRRYHDLHPARRPETWLASRGAARKYKGAGPSDVEGA